MNKRTIGLEPPSPPLRLQAMSEPIDELYSYVMSFDPSVKHEKD